MLVIRMKLVLLLVFLTVGLASSRKIKLVQSIVEESVDTISGESLDNESEAMTVETDEKRRHFDSAEVVPSDTTTARTDKCWRADSPFRWKANCDFRGNKIAMVETKNLPDCQIACKEHEECTHFSYNFACDICSLQKSETRLTEISSENGICGFVVEDADSPAEFVDHARGRNCWKTDEDGVARWGVNCKFNGRHLDSYSTSSLTECRLVCKINEQCTHFNYDYVINMCYLIKTTSKFLKEIPQDNYFCGLINNRFVQLVTTTTTTTTTTTVKPVPSCWTTEQKPLSTRVTYWSDKCGFPGRDFTKYSTSSLSDCRISCSNDQRCTHFTINVWDKLCYLQHSTEPFPPKREENSNNCYCGFVADPNALIPKCP